MKIGKGQNVYKRVQESHPSRDVSRMLKRASEMPKSEAVESLDVNGRTISEAAANFCEISYRSYSDKAKRQRRSLQALQGPQKGKETLSRSVSPEPTLDREILDKPPLRSRSRLDADGDLPECSTCSRDLLTRCARISTPYVSLSICQSRGSQDLTSAAMAYIDRLKLLTTTKAPRG